MSSKTIAQVHLADETRTSVVCDADTTCSDVVALVAEKLELFSNVSDFALVEEGAQFTRLLSGEQKPMEIVNSWNKKNTGRLVMRRVYNMTPEAPIEDPAMKHLTFAQTRSDVVQSRLAVTSDVAVQLAALYLFTVHGCHNPEVHAEGFLAKHIAEYVPEALMKEKSVPEWEAAILAAHAALDPATTEETAVDAYLATMKELVHFGMTTFPARYIRKGKAKIGDIVHVGVSAKGVAILTNPSMEVSGQYAFEQIYSWGASETVFSMSTNEEEEGLQHVFESREASHIAALLQGYVGKILENM
ncbi:hypothetical protein KIPB_011037 [Kipferlia bialata]|uniref:FERM domain-containing protein n=1 Tax=Kipferlia bialata TaxID=797122 RepID=A0A9K3D6S6_9EUKA|nr:hypothetical protein KIPB_011037 [Kipferlia bialata]|eukprot:g11037.t1